MNQKVKFLVSIMLLVGATSLHAQQKEVVITFTAKAADNSYIALDSIKVQNQTKAWTETLLFSDTTLKMFYQGNAIKQLENQSLFLEQNIPNPFEGKSKCQLQLADNENVEITLYDLNGRQCALYKEALNAGNYEIQISVAAAQTYLLHVQTSQGARTVKMLCHKGEGNFDIQTHYQSDAITKVRKAETQNPFENGDQFTYIGYATSNGHRVSDTISGAKDTNSATVAFTVPVGFESFNIVFTAQLHDGSFLAFDSVIIKNITRNKTIVKYYPDTVLNLTTGDVNFLFAPGDDLTYTYYATCNGQIKTLTQAVTKDTNDETVNFTFVNGFAFGDIYYDSAGKPEGLIYWLADTIAVVDGIFYGEHGKMVSLNEDTTVRWGPAVASTSGHYPKYHIHAYDSLDGMRNTDTIMLWRDTFQTYTISDTTAKNRVQAAPWCVKHGEGWYLPAYCELVDLFKLFDELNLLLQNIPGAMQFRTGMNSTYWSSTANSVNLDKTYGLRRLGGWWPVDVLQSELWAVRAVKRF